MPALDRTKLLALCGANPQNREVYVQRETASVKISMRTGRGPFAAWIATGAQPGLHVRSGDAKLPRSTAFRGKHNWVFVAGATVEATRALLDEARRLAGTRGAGKVAATAHDIYKPLAKAIGGLAIAAPLHAGGPAAKVLSGEQEVATALCALCLARTEYLARPADAKLLTRLRAMMKRGSIRYEDLWPAANALPYGTDGAKRAADAAESAPVQAARAILGCRYGSQKCIPFVTKALVRTIAELRATEGDAATAAFVVELDELVLAHELVAAHAKYISPGPPPLAFERVLWRGADAKNFPAYWLARIAKNQYGLLAKVGKRWTWTVDTRDAALATVPDTHFTSAVETAIARDV